MSNEEYRDVLETKRVEIVKSICCERTLLLNHLRSNRVFDQEDCELINAATTNDARVGKLIDFLLKRGPDAYQHFLDVVQIENPTLYESLTGEKATSKSNPLMRQFAFPEPKPGEYSQLQPLAERQQRMLQDLIDSEKRFRDVLKANDTLEKRLERANEDLKFERAKTKHFENRLTREMEIDESLEKNEMLLFHEYDEMEKGIADRDVYIIVLQMKLLAEKEEVEKLKTKIEELEQKNEAMSRELRRVSQSYNHERCQSLKLSECIRLQGDELQKIDELRKQLRECKYKTIIVTEERDAKIQELKELTKWAEVLKTRFDVVEKEKQSSMEKTEVVSNNCVFLQETVRTLNQKLSSTNLELEELRKRNELLTKDCELFKTQRNYALEARKEAVNERDKIISEKETIQAQCNDLLAKRDEMNEERSHLLQGYDSIHTRYKVTSEDLTRVKTALNEKEMEVDDLIRKLKEANEKNRRSSVLFLENLQGLPECCSTEDDEKSKTLERGSEPLDDESSDSQDEEEKDFRRPWRERRMKSLLNSIKTRIAGERPDASPAREHVSLIAGNVTLDVLQHLLPNLTSSRPCSSTEPTYTPPNISNTLKRQMCLRKQKACYGVDNKKRAQTAPCPMENLKDSSSSGNESDSPASVKSASSTPDLIGCTRPYPDDVNVVPDVFRTRSGNLLKKFQRSKSSQ